MTRKPQALTSGFIIRERDAAYRRPAARLETKMAEKNLHHHLDFAKRYSSQFEGTLNAYTALSRLSSLA